MISIQRDQVQAVLPAHSRDIWLFAPLCALLCVLCVLSLFIGAAPLDLGQIWSGLVDGTGTSGIIMREIRLPRLLLGLAIGGMLGLSGAAMQGFLRNPLAEPAIFGAPQAAALGAVLVLYSGLADALSFALPAAAMAGAFGAMALLALLARRRAGMVTLVLAGLAIGSLAGAATSLAINLSPNPFAVMEIVFWLMGSLEDRSLRHVLLAVPFIVMGAVLLMACGPGYRALTLGEETAMSLGIDLKRLRLLTIAGVSLGVGASVAVSGAIGFVGLIAPHLMRPLAGGDPQRLLVPSGLAGAALLVGADMMTRLIPASSEIRIGVLTALIGAPLFLWLVASGRAFFDAGEA